VIFVVCRLIIVAIILSVHALGYRETSNASQVFNTNWVLTYWVMMLLSRHQTIDKVGQLFGPGLVSELCVASWQCFNTSLVSVISHGIEVTYSDRSRERLR